MIIALDVDDVLAAFTPHTHHYFNVPLVKCDYWDEGLTDEKFGKGWFSDVIALRKNFWETLPRLSDPSDIDFDVAYYISAFPEDLYEERKRWLREQGFPDRPLICAFDKLQKCRELGVDVLVDDKPATIKKLQGTDIKGIHFITPYAGFEPIGPHVTNLNQVKNHLSLS
jgi:hypothetical protein